MKPLDQGKLRDITARIIDALAPERVLLFGSYAWGSPDADSDVDLYVIVSDRSEPSHRLARRAYSALRGIGVPVDLVVRGRTESARRARLTSTLDHEVLTRGVPLYG
jgi:predicted nucleotidyltransferase